MTLTFESDMYLVEVSDEGIGIPELEKGRIFDSFYRASNATSFKGTGIGLFIAKQVADAHRAQISLRNNNPTGVTFKVEFSRKNS